MATDSKDKGMAQNAGEAMTEDEAVEDILTSLHRSMRPSAEAPLREALKAFAAAIRKQAKAEMACLLLTRETEAMGGYDDGKHGPECFPGACMPGCTSSRFVTGNLKGAAKGG